MRSHIPSRDGPGLARLRASAEGEKIRERVLQQQETAKSMAERERLLLTEEESAVTDSSVRRLPQQGEYPYPVGTLVWGESFQGVVWQVLGPLGHTLAIHGGEEIVPASLVIGHRAPSPELRRIFRQLRELGFV